LVVTPHYADETRPSPTQSDASPLSLEDGFRFRCGPVEVTHIEPADAVAATLDWVRQQREKPTERGLAVHLVNAWSVVCADKDENVLAALSGPGVNLPDGTPLVWNARLRRADVPAQRVRGPQYFEDVIDRGRALGVRHFLLGGTEETLQLLIDNILERFPGAILAGAESPPFRDLADDERQEQDARIKDSRADIVWVGLGTPKQDFEAERLAQSMPVLAAAVGAAFDFSAGTVRPAPLWMQRNGLEWAHRFATEPRRLWRRYLIGNVEFIRVAGRRRR
jgi:N-acetylglucosaminyldiphosphoundecaprenol N-acetyl-beta-D-mannosaminyltransferase